MRPNNSSGISAPAALLSDEHPQPLPAPSPSSGSPGRAFTVTNTESSELTP